MGETDARIVERLALSQRIHRTVDQLVRFVLMFYFCFCFCHSVRLCAALAFHGMAFPGAQELDPRLALVFMKAEEKPKRLFLGSGEAGPFKHSSQMVSNGSVCLNI